MTIFASDRDWCRVIVGDVSDDWTLVYDYKTGNERRVPTNAPGGLLPLTGDVWIITKDNGLWELSSCIGRNVDSHQRSMGEVLDMLDRIGLIRWRPEEADPMDVLSRNGSAYIGELRRFPSSILPSGWVKATNTINVSISQRRRLFRKIGTTYGGDGITTFDYPNVRDDNTANVTTMGAGWIVYPGRDVHVARSGPLCILQGIVENTSAAAIALPSTICTLPTGYGPTISVSGVGWYGTGAIRMTLTPGGVLTAQDPTGTTTVPINGWIEFNMSYRLEADTDDSHWLICVD